MGIQSQQGNIFDKQLEFQTKQEEFAHTVNQIDDKTHHILANQDKMDANMNNLHDKHSQINDNVETSISMQQISMDQQDKLHAMQHEFSKDMATNNENLQTFLDESNEKQLKILSKQDDAFETISNIRSKTDELHKETENIQNEMS